MHIGDNPFLKSEPSKSLAADHSRENNAPLPVDRSGYTFPERSNNGGNLFEVQRVSSEMPLLLYPLHVDVIPVGNICLVKLFNCCGFRLYAVATIYCTTKRENCEANTYIPSGRCTRLDILSPWLVTAATAGPHSSVPVTQPGSNCDDDPDDGAEN